MVSVIDRAQLVVLQQFGQLPRIDAVILIALLQQSISAWIANHQSRDPGLQQVVQPGGPGSFFKGDMHVSAQPLDKLYDHARPGFDDTFHHDLAGSIPNRDRDVFLMHVHADIFTTASHKGVLLFGWFLVSTETLLQKGRPFILRLLGAPVTLFEFGCDPHLVADCPRQTTTFPPLNSLPLTLHTSQRKSAIRQHIPCALSLARPTAPQCYSKFGVPAETR